MKRLNDLGIEGFPLQLLIVFIVVAIVVPLAWNYVSIYSESQTRESIESQLIYIEAAAREIYTLGPNNTRIVDIDLHNAFNTRIEYLKIGGTANDYWSNLSSFRYKLEGGPEEIWLITNPNIPIINPSGIESFSAGRHTIQLEAFDEFQTGADVDGDGLSFSRYIIIQVLNY